MDKETLSNYGWITITILVLSVMIALATPFGTYIKTAFWNTTTALIETTNQSMNIIDGTITDNTTDNNTNTDNEQGGEIDNTQNGTGDDFDFGDNTDNSGIESEGAGGTSGESYDEMFG